MDIKVTLLNHKGKHIIYANYAGVSGSEFIDILKKQEKLSLRSIKKDIYHLMNFTDCKMENNSRNRANEMLTNLRANGFTVKSACYGITGLQRIIANVVKRDLFFAKDEYAAKDWLTQ